MANGFGSLAPEEDWSPDQGETIRSAPSPAPPAGVDWSKLNQPSGAINDPGGEVEIRARDPRLSMTKRDIDRAMNIALSFSGGGLATEVPKPATGGAREAFDGWVDQLTGKRHGTGQAQATAPAATAEAGMAQPAAAEPGGDGGGDARLGPAQASAEKAAGRYAPLPGLPTNPLKVGNDLYIPGPIAKIKDIAEGYMRDRPTPSYHQTPDQYHPLDPEHAKAIAQAYEEMPHDPDNPAVKNSYDAMIKETRDQYDYLRRNHPELQIEANKPGEDPYAATPRLAAKDVIENNHFSFFPTEQGYGTGEQGGIDMATHPMMQPSGRTLNGKPLLNNDLFRIVHDYFGHLKEGYGFRAGGEDNAWRSHAAMYSDLARPAMTSETRGQNSWVNYGPHGDFNRTASGADTKYADQKVGLMPEWTMRDRGSPEPLIAFQGSPHAFSQMDTSKIGTGEGSGVRGEGLYFAEHSPISEWYRNQLAARHDPLLKKYNLTPDQGSMLGIDLANTGGPTGDHSAVVEDLKDYIENLKAKQTQGDTSMGTKNQIKNSNNMINYLNDPNRAKGHMYQVAIDRPIEHFLDWDKPLKDQSDYVKQQLQPMIDDMHQRMTKARATLLAKAQDKLAQQPSGIMNQKLQADIRRYSSPIDWDNMPGQKLYEMSAHSALGRAPKTSEEGYPISSQYLRSKGIAGVQYESGTIHKAHAGHRNFATFEAPRILKRYALPGLIGGGAAAGAMQGGDDGSQAATP
jgi:hypothetical protein